MVNQKIKKSFSIYIDEAGRGPLAGPVTVGAIIPTAVKNKQLFQDSKQLTAKNREFLFDQINTQQTMKKLHYGVAHQSAATIDTRGIIQALQNATIDAIYAAIVARITTNCDNTILKKHKLLRKKSSKKNLQTLLNNYQGVFSIRKILIDGNHDFGLSEILSVPVETLVRGDQKNRYISMASIAAKVSRDTLMIEQSARYPYYNFQQNKGYGTASHRKAIQERGVCPLHRKTFCKSIIHAPSGKVI